MNSGKNFSDLKTEVGANIQDTSSQMATVIGRFLNRRLRDALQRIHYDPTRLDYSFSTTAGTRDYLMPDDFEHEVYVYDSTNKKTLAPINYQQYIDNYASDTTTQDISDYYLVYDDLVHTQPTSAGTVAVVSTSTSDTSQKVRVKGIVSSVEDTEEVTLNGTSSVAGTKSFTRILSVSIDSSCAGKVTVTRGSDTAAIFRPGDKTMRLKKMRLVRTPSAVATIEVIYKMAFLPLINGQDYPPVEISDILAIGAEADGWRYKRQFDKATAMDYEYERKIEEYLFTQETRPNRTPATRPQNFDRDALY